MLGHYAVIDPVDPQTVLYLSEREYKSLVRVALSTETSLLVIARPGQERPSDWSDKKHDTLSKISPHTYDCLKKTKWWRSAILSIKSLKIEDSRVTIDIGNYDLLVRKFGLLVAAYSGVKVGRGYSAALRHFSSYSRHYLKTRGANTYLLLLKITKLALENYLAGSKLDSGAVGMKIKMSKGGMPLWLPIEVRMAFRARHTGWIRSWFSILNIYRSLECSYGLPSFDTIQAPVADIDLTSFNTFVNSMPQLQSWKNKFSLDSLVPKSFPLLVTGSGVGPGQSILLSHTAARRWTFLPVNHLYEYLNHIGDTRGLDIYKETLYLCQGAAAAEADIWNRKEGFLGELSLKYEAAGKIRVFAMVDYWTQYALLPLHKVFFKILEGFAPMDATFDQEDAVSSFSEEGHTEFYSYDLKSATDLIPAQLYRVVVDAIFGKPLGRLWLSLMVDRDFGLPFKDHKAKIRFTHNDKHYIRYTRGQPMGALSSWASMAFIHHLLVQFSYFRICPLDNITDTFTKYRVLGDDIVIADRQVAEEYVKVCSEFGIPIGLAKSVISPKTSLKGREGDRLFQFANQIVVGSTNVSPISLREELSASSLQSRLELVSRLVRRGWCSPQKARLTFIISRLLPRLWSQSHHLLKVGKTPDFIRALLPVLLSPTSGDIGIKGFQKYCAWYQVLLGSYNLSDLLDPQSSRKSGLSEFLSTQAEKLYKELIANQQWFGLEDNTKLVESFCRDEPPGFAEYKAKISRIFPLYSPWLDMQRAPFMDDSLHELQLPPGLLAVESLMSTEEPVERPNPQMLLDPQYKLSGGNLVKIVHLNVNFMNFKVIQAALGDYITAIRTTISPLLKVPKQKLRNDLSHDIFYSNWSTSDTSRQDAVYGITHRGPGVFCLMTDREISYRNKAKMKLAPPNEVPFDLIWDGIQPLQAERAPEESLEYTYSRLEVLYTLQAIYRRLQPDILLKRALSTTPIGNRWKGFLGKIVNIIKTSSIMNPRQLPSHFFVRREEIIPCPLGK